MRRWLRVLALGAGLAVGNAAGVELARHPALSALAAQLVTEGHYRADELVRLLADARLDPRITEALSRPAEQLPWYRYRPIFVTDARAAEGAAFWNRHAATLRRAEEVFAVPAQVIVAILGVETRYGTHAGRHRVLDALATLGLSGHRRAEFFLSELGEFLRLVREEDLDPRTVVGSYAGAMGLPQFIASSYRHYAVDFDGDGRRDLLGSVPDAIGSVANYLAVHGWASGAPVVVPAAWDGRAPELLADGLEPRRTLAELRAAGVEPLDGELDTSAPGVLLALEGERAPEYYVGFRNFYAITRYNRSPLYAMAVHELSRAVATRREGGG